ncbi:MAG: dTDP-4-dehydrorhamnose reductase [Burkholderiales bacterium]
MKPALQPRWQSNAPRIVITGAKGQLGQDLTLALQALGTVLPLGREHCDLSQPQHLPAVFDEIKPDIILNAAAYTAVDRAEDEEALASRVNGTAVGVLAEQALKHQALLVHYSTDYVFDGSKTEAYSETNTPCPINAYGRSKLAGELALQQVAPAHLLLRTCWVYSRHGQNFMNTILRLAQTRPKLQVVNDQWGAPTWTRDIAHTTLKLLQHYQNAPITTAPAELLHVSARGKTSWFDYASLLLRLQSLACPLEPVSSHDYPSRALRPKNSLLDTTRLETRYGIVLPDWQDSVARCLNSMGY